MATEFQTVTSILSENNMHVQTHVMSYFNIQILTLIIFKTANKYRF